MSIETEISRILSAKASLKTAINNKGGNITNETIDEYASFVEALEIGGGGTEQPPSDVGPYLTFKSTSPFTLNVNDSTKNWDGTLEYSTDTTTWSIWSGTSTLSSINNKLYLRGSNNTLIIGEYNIYKWVLTGANIDCIGNIENLLDYETVALGNDPTMATHCYYSMFHSCTSLTTAPELPALTLTNRCYRSMFYGCTGLTTAPSLPATTLATNCYEYMFYGCTAFKVSTTETESYQYAWRIPTSGTGTTASSWNGNMLKETGGTFTDNPTIDTTYYVENAPV